MTKKQVEAFKKNFIEGVKRKNNWTGWEVENHFLESLEKALDGKKNASDKIFSRMVDVYNEFCIQTTGVKAKFGALEGKSIKSITEYLSANVKTPGDDMVVSAWKFVLDNKSRWDPFHQSQLKLNQIESNLFNILNAIRNGNRQQQATKPKSVADLTNEVLNSPELQRRRDNNAANGGKHLSA